MIRTKPTAAVLALLASAAVLAGCGDDDADHGDHPSTAAPSISAGPGPESADAATGAHNQADIRFAQEMIPHHRQAVAMAALVPGRSADPALIELAAGVQQAQDPEITAMTGWLEAWGVAVPAPAGHMGMDHGEMPGMMTEDQMARLESATGAEFDRMWLEMMIAHHEGAVQMARTELAEGEFGAARAMAQEIIDTQQAEIQQMQAMLQG
ncbi:DUF305 domain-containing protein [Nocardia sp. NPDC024068]|uniref:DUF305 domain-containing protein n=1 Tax=Nocardia sp. NPDC024068 TaxID=3157197 RepID=UPI0033DA632E